MKRLIILFVLISIFTSCQGKSTVDGIARSVFSTLKNNDIEAFRSLFLTSKEMEMLINNGTFKVPDSDRQTAINYYKPEEVKERQDELFKKLRGSNIAWSQTTYEAYEVENKIEEGTEISRIRILLLQNGEVRRTLSFDAFLIPADPSKFIKEKFVIVE